MLESCKRRQGQNSAATKLLRIWGDFSKKEQQRGDADFLAHGAFSNDRQRPAGFYGLIFIHLTPPNLAPIRRKNFKTNFNALVENRTGMQAGKFAHIFDEFFTSMSQSRSHA